MDATRPLKSGAHTAQDGAAGRPAVRAEPASRRSERMEQRERLYSVVRESMVRSGVLSSGYKFKVLSLDARGGQFLVMMDLARDLAREPARLSEIEQLIAQSAKLRFEIVVTAVYWRLNEHVVARQTAIAPPAPGVAAAAAAVTAAAATATAPAPAAAAPAPLARAAAPTAAQLANRHEPLQADEIVAFKAALENAVGTARAQTAARLEAKAESQLRSGREIPAKPVARKGDEPRKPFGWPRRAPAPLTGYEDTQAFDPREQARMRGEPAETLSETQYGDLH